MNYTATIGDPPTPQPELFSLYEEPGGARPDRLSDCQAAGQGSAAHRAGLPALDVPVPQMVDRPLVLLAAFDVLVPEQVIEVPMMSTPTHCPRTLLYVVGHPVEQTVGGERIEVFLVFSQDRGYSLSAEQIVDNPVPRFRRGFGGGLHGLHPGQSSSAFCGADHRAAEATAEQNVDIPVPRGAPHDFHQNPLPAAGSSDLLETANQGVLGTSPRRKKSAKIPRTQGAELGADLQLMASVSSAGGVAGCFRH